MLTRPRSHQERRRSGVLVIVDGGAGSSVQLDLRSGYEDFSYGAELLRFLPLKFPQGLRWRHRRCQYPRGQFPVAGVPTPGQAVSEQVSVRLPVLPIGGAVYQWVHAGAQVQQQITGQVNTGVSRLGVRHLTNPQQCGRTKEHKLSFGLIRSRDSFIVRATRLVKR